MNNERCYALCSECFRDEGLRLDARKLGLEDSCPCPRCGDVNGRKLTIRHIEYLAYRFFEWGSLIRYEFGAAPLYRFHTLSDSPLQPNDQPHESFHHPAWLAADVCLIERTLRVRFFEYGPRLWMTGSVGPLTRLSSPGAAPAEVDRILREYPERCLQPEETFYRLRTGVRRDGFCPADDCEFDSPPAGGKMECGRLDTRDLPVLYASPDLQVCIHECRVTAEDDIYVGTLAPTRELRLLDLTAIVSEGQTDESESLDMAVHMLFLAGKHSYGISRRIAAAAYRAGLDGLLYPSYYSLLRTGAIPFETSYGFSHRRLPRLHEKERSKIIPCIAIFGHPVCDGVLIVRCINRLVLDRIEYDYHFGPAYMT